MFVGFASRLQTRNCVSHFAVGVEAGFKVVVVKLDFKGLQVQVLFMAQIGHGKLANTVQVMHIAASSETAVVRRDSFLGQEIGRNVCDVLAVVKGFAGRVVWVGRPTIVARLKPLCAQLGAFGQGIDLYAGIVVIELAVDIQALRFEQIANRVAQGGLSAVAHV